MCRAHPIPVSTRVRSFGPVASKLFDMTFADFEAKIRDELDRMLGPGGFSSARDILAITVNRWSHGYGYVANSLFDGDDYEETLAACPPDRRARRHCEFRCRWGCVCASRHRPGRTRGPRIAEPVGLGKSAPHLSAFGVRGRGGSEAVDASGGAAGLEGADANPAVCVLVGFFVRTWGSSGSCWRSRPLSRGLR